MEFSNVLLDIFTLPIYLFGFLLIGKFLYGNLRQVFKDDFFNSFLEITLGFILSICFYAIFKTTGKTIMVLFVLLLLGQFLYAKLKPDILWYKKINKTDFQTIGLFFGFAIVFLAVQLFRHDYFNPVIVKLGWGDYGYYSDLAESFNSYGIENGGTWYNYFNSDTVSYNNNPGPYHYFEIWTQALFLNTTSNSGVFVFIYLFTPFICALIGTGFFVLGTSLINNITKIKTIVLLICATLMPFFIGKLPFLLGGFDDNVFYYPRNFLFYVLFMLFFQFYRKGLKSTGVYFIAALSCVNILYLPTVSIVLLLLAIFQYYFSKENNRTVLTTLILGLLPSIFVFIFYFVIFKGEGGSGFVFSAFTDVKAYLLKGLHYFFRLQLARIWFFYLPLLLVSIFFFWNARKSLIKKEYRIEVILVIIGLELVSLLFASFVPHLEAGTFNSIVLNPLFAVLTFIGVVFVLNNTNQVLSKVIFGILIIQLSYSLVYVLFNLGGGSYEGKPKFGRTFLHEVSQLEIKNKVGGFFKDEENQTTSAFAAKPNLSWFTAIFDHKGDGYFQVDISTYIKEEDIPFESIKEVVLNTPMYKYGSNKLENENMSDLATIRLAFIEDYALEYFILYPNVVVPDYLVSKIKTMIEDPYSRVRVIVLK